MTAGPRTRLLASTIEAVQELGVHGAGLADLLNRANASRNSVYQHFPAGKSELVQVAARIVQRLVGTHLAKTRPAGQGIESVEAWLDDLIAFWRDPLERSGYTAGSFMMAAALAAEDADVQAVAGHAFSEWRNELTAGLVAAGVVPDEAPRLASVVLSAIEGAIMQSRALKSARPFDDLRKPLAAMICQFQR